MTVFRRYVETAGSGVAAKVISAGSGVAVLWLLNRILGKADFGTLMLVLAISATLASIVSSGFSQVLLYRISRMEATNEHDDMSRHMLGTVLAYGIGVAILVSVILFFLADRIPTRSAGASLSLWIVAACIIMPLDVVRYLVTAWHRARQRVHTAVIFRDVLPAVLLPSILLFLLLTQIIEVGPVVAGVIYGVSYSLPATLLLLRTTPSFRIWIPVFSKWDLRYGSRMLLTQLTSQPARQIDILIVGLIASPEITAEYVLAAKLVQFLMIGKSSFAQLLVPRMGNLLHRGEQDRLRFEYDSTRMAGLLIAVGVSVVFVGWTSELLGSFGDYRATSALLVLTAGMLIRIGVGASGSYLAMAGYGGWTFSAAFTGMVVNLFLALLWVPQYGAVGAAMSFFAAGLLQNLLTVSLGLYLDGFRAMTAHATIYLMASVGMVLLAAAEIIPDWAAALGLAALAIGMIVQMRDHVKTLFRSGQKTRDVALTISD